MALKDLLLDSSHDLQLVNNDLALASGTQATLQAIGQRLKLWQGEWFLDVTAGVPYLQQVFTKGTKLSVIRSLLLAVVAKTNGVTAIRRFDVFPQPNRGLDVEFEASTLAGDAELNLALGVG